jgi:hypothetical protein
VHGDTPDTMKTIQGQQMINEIEHIQTTQPHLPASARALISRDITSLQAMTSSALTSYLYGAREVVEAYRHHRHRETGQQRIEQFFQPRRRNSNEPRNRAMASDIP